MLNGPGEGRARPGRLTLPRGLRLMVDVFAEQFADAARPTDRRLVLLGRVGF